MAQRLERQGKQTPGMANPANDWLLTPMGDPRGYIQPHALTELWFHTGTACNLACPFCLEGSSPGDIRLDRITLQEIKPLLHEAIELGVEQFSFTGGEPFIVKDFVNILNYASKLRPCLVLTNGTDALLKRLQQLEALRQNPHRIAFRISIDWPDRERHEQGRGAGTFDQSLESIVRLQTLGFAVSLARQAEPGEDIIATNSRFQALLQRAGYQGEIRIVAFPDFAVPGANPAVPVITEDCMTRYQNEASRRQFMCAFSKMVVKRAGRLRVYACTLVDDDEDYDQGNNLRGALQQRVLLKHHRCYSCFAYGSSCSEL
jgi:sulfatase maturation enzyme AslB (radical SAM superfamily)